jgi:hypothetical protein
MQNLSEAETLVMIVHFVIPLLRDYRGQLLSGETFCQQIRRHNSDFLQGSGSGATIFGNKTLSVLILRENISALSQAVPSWRALSSR